MGGRHQFVVKYQIFKNPLIFIRFLPVFVIVCCFGMCSAEAAVPVCVTTTSVH